MTDATDIMTRRLTGCYTGVVHDVMRDMGLRDFVLPHTVRPIEPGPRLAGPVFTVSGQLQPGLDPHETLLRWTALLSRAPKGHVLVIQPNDSTVSHMGELSAETLKLRGIRGCVIDGGCRDVERVLEIGLPVYCRYFTPADVVGQWAPTDFDIPVLIGDCRIAPGDFVAADRDGVCIVPRDRAAEIAEAAEGAMNKENLVRKAILSGEDPQKAYLQFGKF